MKNNENMMCDLDTGICGVAEEEASGLIDFSQPEKAVTLYYVTDPICSHCWAIEPVLRRFIEQYGHTFKFQTVMGGLLEKWHDGPIDPANGIYKPADVAGHWREVGEHSRMPIDGSLMIDNPVHSSYPPSRVFKVIQQKHSNAKANEYLRRAREALFAFNRNIAQDEVMVKLLNEMELDGKAIVYAAAQPAAQQALTEDFALARSLGARGFPSIIMINAENKGIKIVGGQAFEKYVEGLKQVMSPTLPQPKPLPALLNILQKEKLLFSKEIEVLYDLPKDHVQQFVEKELSEVAVETNELLGESYYTLAI